MSTPAGVSVRQCLHYLQMIRNGEFNQFDYENARMNREIYGTNSPPPYDLTKITAPVNIYYSKDDDTATIQNAVKLFPKLKNLKSTYMVPLDDFNHVDFTYSRFLLRAVYEKLIGNINKANGL